MIKISQPYPKFWQNNHIQFLFWFIFSLFQVYRKKSCETCETIPAEPTLCLVCGAFLCLRGKCCERQNKRECVRVSYSIEYWTTNMCGYYEDKSTKVS